MTGSGELPLEDSSRKERSLLRNRDYVMWLCADTSWQLGTAIRSFAMTLVVIAVTSSYVDAGLVTTVSNIVAIAAALPGGVVVDRLDRRTSLTLSGLLRFLLYSLAAASWWLGLMSTPVLYAIGVGGGLIYGLFGTASNAALKSVVVGPDLPRAVVANQGRDAAVSLVASPVSGLLAGVSYALPFAADAAGSLVQILVTKLIRADLRPMTHNGEHAPAAPEARSRVGKRIAELGGGLSLCLSSPVLRQIVPAVVFLNAGFTLLYTALVLFFQSIGTQPWRIGMLSAALAMGTIIGSVFSSRLVAKIPTGRLVVVLFCASVIFLIPLVFSQSQPVVLVVFALTGLMLPGLNGGLMGYAQSVIPEELQGRAFAVVMLVQQAVPGLMPSAAGLLLEHFGVVSAVVAAVVLHVVGLGFIVGGRRIRELPIPDQWHTVSPGPS